MTKALIPTLTLSALAILWITTRRRRQLPSYEEIVAKIYRGEVKGLSKFLPHDPVKDLLKEDIPFWVASGGHEGLRRKRHNAICYVQLCQRLHRDNDMPEEDIQFVHKRALLIVFLIRCALVEELFRVFKKDLPHICARWAIYLYCELEKRAKMLNLEYGTL